MCIKTLSDGNDRAGEKVSFPQLRRSLGCPSPHSFVVGRGNLLSAILVVSRCALGNIRFPIVLLFVLLIVATLCGCSGKAAAGADLQKQTGSGMAVPVMVAQADTQDVAVELRNIGNVEAYSTVTIRSQDRPDHQGPLSR